MLINIHVNKKHFIFLIYFFFELLKRQFKSKYPSIPKNANNLLIFISHFLSFIFYLIEKWNSKNKNKEKENKIDFIYVIKHLFHAIMLIFFCSILDLITYYPVENFPILKQFTLIKSNITEFYMIVCFILEKMFLKIKYYKHHYLSFVLFLIYPIYNLIKINNEKNHDYSILKIFLHLIYYCFFHYYPMGFVYVIYYYLDRKYFISIYLISCIKGIICIIGTITIEYFNNYPKQLFFFINTSKYNFINYFFMFCTLICMTIQNYLHILIILYFLPSFTGITFAYVSTILSIIDILSNKKEISEEIFTFIFQIICIFSICIYLEMISLGCFNLDYNVKKAIKNRAISSIEWGLSDSIDSLPISELDQTI